MRKVVYIYAAIYIISVLITLYGFISDERFVLSGIYLMIFITPPFLVYLYMKRK